jgi:hypothetical protein
MAPHDPSPAAPPQVVATAEPLPDRVDLGQLRRRAKDLRRAVLSGNPEAVDAVRRLHPGGGSALTDEARGFSLRDAQVVIARRHGFAGWPELIQAAGTKRVAERDMHRWFGVEFNNECWDLLDGADGAPADERDAETLLYGAYAAARHWSEVGTAAHRARAEHLISRAELVAGSPEAALRHARRCLGLLEEHADLAADWDWPFAHEALARALAATGDIVGGADHRRRAVELTASLADPADREILETELSRAPWFGLDT